MNSMQTQTEIQQVEEGNIVSCKGFLAGGLHAGLRYSKKDIGLILSEKPASAAAVYTQNVVQAAPILATRESLSNGGLLQAVIVNSACANACTGERGLQDALTMRQLAADKFGLLPGQVAVASTGVIGEYLDMKKIENGINSLEATNEAHGASDFETAILTTDTVTKQCAYRAEIAGSTVTIGGAAKGSGMIHPNMATMLGFLTTDAAIGPNNLQLALRQAVDQTFNQITVDGDTSTNDMVLIMANGLSGNEELVPSHADWPVFIKLITAVCEDLAKKIARDGEGATKLIEVSVKGSKTKNDARMIAKTIVGSSLVKTAVFGCDANWGRIIAAMGRSGVGFNPQQVDISIEGITMLRKGIPVPFSEEDASNKLKNDHIVIEVALQEGNETGTAWGCDLSYDYVRINGSYRT
ncbi:bifunctional ornithine acetyltransferase/N-acetylglutamate synthase [Bacillus sp. 1P06AnD]|uniref:bifunctional ornithine acetyltransferase/N-acetylglutamate synthase n=1 Tax=Bacillus sp. 1P06AnD TaxID=3132208 RepID=UPI0039A28305